MAPAGNPSKISLPSDILPYNLAELLEIRYKPHCTCIPGGLHLPFDGSGRSMFRNAGTPMVAAVTPAVAAAVFKNLRRETFSSLCLVFLYFFTHTILLL